MAGSGSGTPGWYPDPEARHESRYWDGSTWTAHVADNGVASNELPPPIVPASDGADRPALATVLESPTPTPKAKAKGNGKKWLLIGTVVVVVVLVIGALASKSDDSGSSGGGGGGGSFHMKIADQAVFLAGDFGDIDRLGNDTNATAYCDDAAASLQRATEIVSRWSSDLQKAWSAAEGHFETAVTACRAGDGQAMVRAYNRAESLLDGLRSLLGRLDCHLDPQDPSGEICK